MKKVLAIALTAAMAMPTVALADDQSIMFEIGIGFGASGGRTDGNDKAKFCKNRNTDRLVMGAVRYRYNDTEAHLARWFHDEDTRCNRDTWAVGVGYVLDTQKRGEADDLYATWTPGLAYTWGDNKNFRGQDETDTNWRQTSNWQVFNRVAVGTGGRDGIVGRDGSLEIAVNHYGSFEAEHGESFVTLALGGRKIQDNETTSATRGLVAPVPEPTVLTITATPEASVGDNTGGATGPLDNF